MKTFVFLGPSLPRAHAEQLIDAVFLPPVAMGDVYVLTASRARPGDRIAIIDGVFEQVPAVWHKEILFALSKGLHVYGAASMGALRACELQAFGMRGVGRIFEAFRDGVLEDDDEVAVAHAPAEYGYRQISDSMASIRFRLSALAEKGAIAREQADAFTAFAKSLPYGDRSWAAVEEFARNSSVPDQVLSALDLAAREPDAKAQDARALLELLASTAGESSEPFRAGFTFQNTSLWASLVQSNAMRVNASRYAEGTFVDDDRDAVYALFSAGCPERDRALNLALLDYLTLEAARSYEPTRRDLQDAAYRIAWRNSISGKDDLQQWMLQQHLSETDWTRMVEMEARRYWLRGRLISQLDDLAVMQIKAHGLYAEWRQRLGATRAKIGESGSSKHSVEDFGITYDDLQSWYEQRFGKMIPDPDTHSREHGFGNLRTFLTSVLANYLVDDAEAVAPSGLR